MDWLTYVIILIVVLLLAGIKVITEYQRAVVFRLGRLVGTRGPGLIYVLPIFEKMVRVGLRTVTMNIPSQKIITKGQCFNRYRGGGVLSRGGRAKIRGRN